MRWPFPRTPALGRDLPANYVEAERVFDRRVKERFPRGTSEDTLKAEVLKQGFKLLPAYSNTQDATAYRGWIIKRLWSVRWRAERGLITEIWGVYGSRAP